MKLDIWHNLDWNKTSACFQLFEVGYENLRSCMCVYLVFFGFVIDLEFGKEDE